MPALRYVHVDVFTSRRFEGNQLAVFLDGTGLSDVQMQTIAREMNFSESTFVLPEEAPGNEVRMRIFTPGREMPMAGHPTVGSTFALALDGVIPAGRRRWTFGLNIGPTPVDIDWAGDRPAFAWMTQQRPVFGNTVADVDAGLPESGGQPIHLRLELPEGNGRPGIGFEPGRPVGETPGVAANQVIQGKII